MAELLGNPLSTKSNVILEDINEYVLNGIYNFDFYKKPNSPDPNSYNGFLIVMRNSLNQILQFAIVSNKAYLRSCTISGSWAAWIQL